MALPRPSSPFLVRSTLRFPNLFPVHRRPTLPHPGHPFAQLMTTFLNLYVFIQLYKIFVTMLSFTQFKKIEWNPDFYHGRKPCQQKVSANLFNGNSFETRRNFDVPQNVPWKHVRQLRLCIIRNQLWLQRRYTLVHCSKCNRSYQMWQSFLLRRPQMHSLFSPIQHQPVPNHQFFWLWIYIGFSRRRHPSWTHLWIHSQPGLQSQFFPAKVHYVGCLK